jgi:hypothetical protein
MSIFDSILDKLGIDSSAPQVQDTMPYNPKPRPVNQAEEDEEEDYEDYEDEDYDDEEDDYEEEEEEVEEVDVMAILEELADEHDEDLNWEESIVDLLKLLEMDSSLSERKRLAKELGCPASKMAESAQMNMWLHKKVLQKIAQNGGNIPKRLLK